MLVSDRLLVMWGDSRGKPTTCNVAILDSAGVCLVIDGASQCRLSGKQSTTQHGKQGRAVKYLVPRCAQIVPIINLHRRYPGGYSWLR